jgi:hypothetical protein
LRAGGQLPPSPAAERALWSIVAGGMNLLEYY